MKERLAALPVLGTVIAVLDRYREDDGNQYAAAIAFYGFLSLFPLLLVAMSVTGFVLAGDENRQAAVIGAVIDAIPGFGGAIGETQVGAAVDTLVDNRGSVGIVGLIALVFSGLRVIDTASAATAHVQRMPRSTSVIRQRLWDLRILILLGGLGLIGAAATTLTGALGPASVILAPTISLGLDTGLFLLAYRYLAPGGPELGRLWPGAVAAGVAWTVLKTVGATIVSARVSEANALYGTLGGVFALLFLLFLAGRIYLYGAELNEVLAQPRAGDGRLDDHADEDAGHDDEPVTPAPLSPPPPPGAASPAVTGATRQRLDEADRAARARRDPNPTQRAIAFLLGLGLVAGAARVLGLPKPDPVDPRERQGEERR